MDKKYVLGLVIGVVIIGVTTMLFFGVQFAATGQAKYIPVLNKVCLDSDGGNSPHDEERIKGTVTKGYKTYTDVCYDEVRIFGKSFPGASLDPILGPSEANRELYEFYCEDNEVRARVVSDAVEVNLIACHNGAIIDVMGGNLPGGEISN